MRSGCVAVAHPLLMHRRAPHACASSSQDIAHFLSRAATFEIMLWALANRLPLRSFPASSPPSPLIILRASCNYCLIVGCLAPFSPPTLRRRLAAPLTIARTISHNDAPHPQAFLTLHSPPSSSLLAPWSSPPSPFLLQFSNEVRFDLIRFGFCRCIRHSESPPLRQQPPVGPSVRKRCDDGGRARELPRSVQERWIQVLGHGVPDDDASPLPVLQRRVACCGRP